MLVGTAGFSEPGVVGDIDQQRCIVFGHGPGKSREYDFVTNLNANLVILPRQGVAYCAGLEISDLGDDLSQKREPLFKWYIFPIRYQMGLVVFTHGFCLRADQIRTVIVLYHVIFAHKRRTSDQMIRSRLMNTFKYQFRWFYIV